MKKLIYIFFILSSISVTNAQKSIPLSSKPYMIVNTATGQEIDLLSMIQVLVDKDIILFGEEHNDTTAHALQLALTQRLYDAKKEALALSFEMWERDVQYIMDEYLQGWIREKNFIKESRAWSNHKDYMPMVDFAKEKKLSVICANTPARYTNMVTRGQLQALEVLPKCVRKNYLPPMPIQLLDGKYKEKFDEILGGHSMPGVYMYQSQNLWDATMAHAIYQYHRRNKNSTVLHFNGRFHSDDYQGVYRRLKSMIDKRTKMASISAFAASEYDHAQHQTIADFVIITPVLAAQE